MTLRQRMLLYFYGAPHMLGSLLALMGLGFFFAGLIKSYWYLIVPGLYMAGALIMPGSREYHLKLRQESDIVEIRKALDKLLDSCRNEVARIVYDRVQSIVSSIQLVLARLEHADESDHAAYTIREMALTYLPETLENYMRLPRAYARFHPVRDGKTSRELLLEQLAVLDAEMKQVAQEVNRDNVDALEAHGRFLQSRFGHSDKFNI